MKKHFGVMVYEILPNGCLHGVGSDTHPNTANRTYNEVAIQTTGSGITGKYKCSYINLNGNYTDCQLTIGYNDEGQLEFIWISKGEKYRGTGWQVRENQLVVYYLYDF